QNSKTGISKQTRSLDNRQSDGVAIERNPAHDVLRSRIPRVVFPKGQYASWAEHTRESRGDVGSICRSNVMKDAVNINQVDCALCLEVVDQIEVGPVIRIRLFRDGHGIRGKVEACKPFGTRQFEQKRGCRSGAASKIENVPGLKSQGAQPTGEQPYAVLCEEFPVFSGYGDTGRE